MEQITPDLPLERTAHFIVQVDTGIGPQWAHLELDGSTLKGAKVQAGPGLGLIVHGPFGDAESAWAEFNKAHFGLRGP